MGRTGAAGAEIVLGPHQSVTKWCCQMRLAITCAQPAAPPGAGDPLRPVRAVRFLSRRVEADGRPRIFDKSPRDFGAESGRLAAKLKMCVLRLPIVNRVEHRVQVARLDVCLPLHKSGDTNAALLPDPFLAASIRADTSCSSRSRASLIRRASTAVTAGTKSRGRFTSSEAGKAYRVLSKMP